jgi:hypothetical protein
MCTLPYLPTPVSPVHAEPLHWIIAPAGADFEGKATKSGDAYEREFRQFGSKHPLVLKKADRVR